MSDVARFQAEFQQRIEESNRIHEDKLALAKERLEQGAGPAIQMLRAASHVLNAIGQNKENISISEIRSDSDYRAAISATISVQKFRGEIWFEASPSTNRLRVRGLDDDAIRNATASEDFGTQPQSKLDPMRSVLIELLVDVTDGPALGRLVAGMLNRLVAS